MAGQRRHRPGLAFLLAAAASGPLPKAYHFLRILDIAEPPLGKYSARRDLTTGTSTANAASFGRTEAYGVLPREAWTLPISIYEALTTEPSIVADSAKFFKSRRAMEARPMGAAQRATSEMRQLNHRRPERK